MKYTDDINIFKLNKDFTAEIDITGTFGHIYHYPQRMNGCLFILCLRGECDITIHLSELSQIQQRIAEWNKLFQFHQELSFGPD